MTRKKAQTSDKGGVTPSPKEEDTRLWKFVADQVTPISSNRYSEFDALFGKDAKKASLTSKNVKKAPKNTKTSLKTGAAFSSLGHQLSGLASHNKITNRDISADPSSRQNVPGLDRNTSERLRKGKMEIEGRLDLHGLTRRVAHSKLRSFLGHAHRQGWRCVLVITGKGSSAHQTDDAPFMGGGRKGILREEVPRWLSEPDMRRLVLDYRTAQTRHGGGGALYVLLRRARG